MTSSAGVSVRVAARVIASPIATLGPVVDSSLNRVVPISESPTITVPALVKSVDDDRSSATPIARAGSPSMPMLAKTPRDE